MNFKSILTIAMLFAVTLSFAQSKTTEALEKEYGGRAFFFYHNTLRAINQKEDPALDALIENVEKLKVLLIDKGDRAINHKAILADYQKENFESAMSSRVDGKTFDIFLKGEKETEGVIVIVNDATTLFVLDIVGSIALEHASKLFKTLNESEDIANQLKAFMGDEKKKQD
jgi:hypothetical protein